MNAPPQFEPGNGAQGPGGSFVSVSPKNPLDHWLRRDDRGATAVEYALFAGLIAAVIIGTVLVLGQVVLGLFNAPLSAGF
jgi:Flp pilus assembly pilin Flp